jgi:hypothetical protein
VGKEARIEKLSKRVLPSKAANVSGPALKIEGRISVLFRGRGMKRCPDEGRERFETFVGACVLANNLMIIAHLLIEKEKREKHNRQRKAA